MTVGKCVLYGIIGNRFPNAVFLDVSHLCFVEVYLAEIVKKGGDRKAFLGKLKAVFISESRTLYEVAKALVNVETVLKKSTLVRTVKACACGRCEEVTLAEKIEELVAALARYAGTVYLDKLVLIGHMYKSPFIKIHRILTNYHFITVFSINQQIYFYFFALKRLIYKGFYDILNLTKSMILGLFGAFLSKRSKKYIFISKFDGVNGFEMLVFTRCERFETVGHLLTHCQFNRLGDV